MSTRAKVLAGLLLVGVLLLVSMGVSKADTIDVRAQTNTVTALPQGFDIKAREVRAAGCAHAFVVTLDNPISNVYGHIQVWPAVDTEWCSGRHYLKVTALPYFHCYTKGGFYSFDGCKKDIGGIGYSYLSALADWHYHWIINGLTFDKTPALNVQLSADGHARGSWYWFTG
jgi:hypothetical protein